MSMTLETLLQSLPSREDLASAVGLESRQSPALDIVPALSLFGTGMLFGAGLALLFAPKSGQDMRRDLGQSIKDYGYGQGGDLRGERQMASQSAAESSRYSAQQDYPRQMSGQTSTEQTRQMSGPTASSGSRQMSGHKTEERSESELSSARTPGAGSRTS